MRVLFVTSAWSQHYFMMVPLAWAFRSAGHEVMVAGAPNMREVIARTGLPVVATGPEIDIPALFREALPETHRERPADAPLDETGKVFETWAKVTRSGLAEVVDLARRWHPDLIVCDPLAPTGLVAAHLLGIPGIRHLWSVDILGSSHGEQLIAHLPGVYEPFHHYGLHPTGDPATATIDPYPPSLQPPPGPTRKPIQFVPYNGPGNLDPRILQTITRTNTTRPRVCITLGNSTTLAAGHQAFPATTVMNALHHLGAQTVIAINPRDRDLLPTHLPPNTTVLHSPPLHMLLPTCHAVVHQGGTGGILTAARNALPQLAITSQPESAQNADSLVSRGSGMHVAAEQCDAVPMVDHLDRLLNDESLQRAAGELQAEIQAQPTPQQVATELAA